MNAAAHHYWHTRSFRGVYCQTDVDRLAAEDAAFMETDRGCDCAAYPFTKQIPKWQAADRDRLQVHLAAELLRLKIIEDCAKFRADRQQLKAEQLAKAVRVQAEILIMELIKAGVLHAK